MRTTRTGHDGTFRFERLAAYSSYVLTTEPALRLDLDAMEKTRTVVRLKLYDVTDIDLELRAQKDDVRVSDCGTTDSTQNLEDCLARAVQLRDARISSRFTHVLQTFTSAIAMNVLLDGSARGSNVGNRTAKQCANPWLTNGRARSGRSYVSMRANFD